MKAIGILLVMGATIGQAALLRQKSTTLLSGLEKTQSDAGAVLSALLKNLQSEQKSADRFTTTFQQWCQDSEGQKQSMVETMQRKVDETNIMMRQISLETKRLESELALVQANNKEKMEQLQEANDTESFVGQQFSTEVKQMDKTIEAAHHALRLAVQNADHQNTKSGDAAAAVNNLLQVNSDTMTDSEKDVMGSYVDDPKPADSSRPQELANSLNDMLGRLESDRSAAVEGHVGTDRKATNFMEHLNSSIFETNSQVASIQMEIAQRRREQIRLEGQVADTSKLLSSIKGSKKSTHAACFTYSQEQAQVAKVISAEIDAAKTVLEETSPESADMLLSPSFLQVQQDTAGIPTQSVLEELSSMARKYPNEATWYLSEAKNFHHVGSPRVSLSEHHAVTKQSSADPSSDALQDIQQFVDTEDPQEENGDAVALSGEARPLLSDPAEAQKIKSSYKSLLAHVKAKQQSVQDNEKLCEFAVREAKFGATKTAQTVNRMNARLDLMQGAVTNYEKDSMYYKSQVMLMETEMKKLSALSSEVDRQNSDSYGALGDFSKQLMSVASELSELLTAEEKRAADMTKALVEKLEDHQSMLEVNHRVWGKSKAALLQAEAAVQTALGTNIQHNDRRIVQFQIQSQFLTHRLHLKQHDTVLSSDFKDIAKQMCSTSGMKSMKSQIESLQKQADELQKSFAENVAPFA